MYFAGKFLQEKNGSAFEVPMNKIQERHRQSQGPLVDLPSDFELAHMCYIQKHIRSYYSSIYRHVLEAT